MEANERNFNNINTENEDDVNIGKTGTETEINETATETNENNLGSNNDEPKIMVYKYRWTMLFIFCLFTVVNFMQFLQFTIIANVVKKFYGVGTFLVDATGLIFFVAYILLFLPISYLIEKYNLRITALVSTGLTLAGSLVKLLCVDPNRFYVILIGQGLAAIGQVYMLSIPSKFASTWFGHDEVSTACALAVLGTQLGAALGSVIPPFVVENNASTEVIGKNLLNMMISYAVVCLVVFIVVLAFFRSRPKLPPSQSQAQLIEEYETKVSFFESCKQCFRNRDFLLLLVSFGLFNGLWNAFGILVNNIYINYFPGGEDDVGIITLIAIIAGGCIGSVIFGIILDKTHEFKKISIAVLVLSSVFFILVVYTLLAKNRTGSYISIPAFGFFAASALVISFEYTLEVTYPVPESVSCSILNATIFLFGILGTVLFEYLIEELGYLNAFIAVLCTYIFCTIILLFISSNLRRHNANVANGDNRRYESEVTSSVNSATV